MHDPERMLQNEVVAACRQSLDRGAARRRALKSADEWRAWRDDMLGVIRRALPDMIFDRTNPMNARVVSTRDCGDYRIENVLLESLPGWEVNVDGKPSKIYQADFINRAAYIPKGQHTVEFIYKPESFRKGMQITLASIIVMVLAGGIIRWGLRTPK